MSLKVSTATVHRL